MRGVHKRMGEEVHSNFALSIRVLHKILGHLDSEWIGGRTMEKRKQIVEIACFLVLAFCLGLRGEEVVKMDIAGFLTYFEAGKDHPEHPHVMVPLLGRFKGETGERWHLLPIVWKTRSGIKFGNAGALYGGFAGVGNLLKVLPAALSHALMLGMPLTDRGGWRI